MLWFTLWLHRWLWLCFLLTLLIFALKQKKNCTRKNSSFGKWKHLLTDTNQSAWLLKRYIKITAVSKLRTGSLYRSTKRNWRWRKGFGKQRFVKQLFAHWSKCYTLWTTSSRFRSTFLAEGHPNETAWISKYLSGYDFCFDRNADTRPSGSQSFADMFERTVLFVNRSILPYFGMKPISL